MNLTDYPNFDPQVHTYIVAMAGGEGEEGSFPILDHVMNDMRRDAEADFVLQGGISEEHAVEWVDTLFVVDRSLKNVATFNTFTGQWETTQRGSDLATLVDTTRGAYQIEVLKVNTLDFEYVDGTLQLWPITKVVLWHMAKGARIRVQFFDEMEAANYIINMLGTDYQVARAILASYHWDNEIRGLIASRKTWSTEHVSDWQIESIRARLTLENKEATQEDRDRARRWLKTYPLYGNLSEVVEFKIAVTNAQIAVSHPETQIAEAKPLSDLQVAVGTDLPVETIVDAISSMQLIALTVFGFGSGRRLISVSEYANAENISVAAASLRISRAIGKLRKHFFGNEVDQDATGLTG